VNKARVMRREARVAGNNRDATHRRWLSSRLAPRSSILDPRHGVTLIELLITITIIATLSAAFLGASRSAMELARRSRTKTAITKIHTLLMERWQSYTTRRVDVNTTGLTQSQLDDGRFMADLRLLGLRELMKLEMPDRWSDVDLTQSLTFLQNIPAITRAYDRRLVQALNATNRNTLERNGSAECLYLTVMLHTGDGEARTLFSRQDIGDTDGDGAQEFLDGWGNPIRWVRWPAGFVGRSDLMLSDPNNLLTGNPDADHDPFDPFRRNSGNAIPTSNYSGYPANMRPYVQHLRGLAASSPPATFNIGYRLVPLVFSMGPDGIGDISTRVGNIASTSNGILLDPYAWDSTNKAYEFGSYGDNPKNPDGDDNSLDNIHNHLLDNK